VITVAKDGDLSYLQFAECLLPIDDFDVAGRPYLADGYEALSIRIEVSTRPGDTGPYRLDCPWDRRQSPESFPYLIDIRDPQGARIQNVPRLRRRNDHGRRGFCRAFVAPTGKYAVVARIGEDYIIGRTEVMVEEFMPDRIKVTATTDREVYRTGDTIHIDARAMFLFGPPAKGHRVSGSWLSKRMSSSPGVVKLLLQSF